MAQSNPLPDPFFNNPSVQRNLDSIANSGVKAISASDRIFTHPGIVRFTGGPNLTVGTDSLGVSISGASQSNQAFTLSGSNLSVSNSAVLTGSNIVTVKTSAGQKFVIDASTSQSVQPVGSLDLAGNTAGTMATLPFASNIELAGGANITLSQSSGASSSRITISGAAAGGTPFTLSGSNTSYSNSAVLSGSNAATIRSTTGQAFIVDVPTQTTQPVGSLDLAGNTAGTMATLPFASNIELAGGNNITLSQSSGASSSRITISGVNTVAQSSETGSLIPAGNTTGTTASLPFFQNIQLSGGNNITLSQSSGTNSTRIGISGPNTVAQSSETGSLVPAGNTTGTTASLPFFQNIQLAGGNKITLSQSSGTNSTQITISAANQAYSLQRWDSPPGFQLGNVNLTNITDISKTPFYYPVEIGGSLTMGRGFGYQMSRATTGVDLFTMHLGVYTYANRSSANLLGSYSAQISATNTASNSGIRNFNVSAITTHATLSSLSPGQYLFGMMFSAASTSAMNYSLRGPGSVPFIAEVIEGTNSYGTRDMDFLFGRGTTTVNAMPANVSGADLVNMSTGASMPLRPWVMIF